MKNLYLISCISKDNGIGYQGDLLWHIPEDMKFFRQTTLGSTVIMGRKTYESIGKPLSKRENVILSRNSVEGIKTFTGQDELKHFLESSNQQKFIIGGATLYEMFIDEVEKLYLTEVDAVKPADTYFPTFDKSKFSRKVLQAGEQDGATYEIVEYTRK